ncbi:helix-turn-helix transcriptional regulator [Streptomyces sp. NPDC048663]|uniref:helix-turn-helix transcriptional regulator n=1 Tax=Streptomyces sp. NPDC048663 TaxID=3155638 RepID=UPI00343DD76F
MSTPPENVKDVMDVVRARVKELRGRKGWSGAQMGEQLAALGVPWNRSVVANFESGRRPAVSVQELLALALVLDVAPVHLLVPLDPEPYQVTPESSHVHDSDDVWRWIKGERPLPGTQTTAARTFYAEVPAAEIKRRGHIYPLGTAYEVSSAGDLGERDDG